MSGVLIVGAVAYTLVGFASQPMAKAWPAVHLCLFLPFALLFACLDAGRGNGVSGGMAAGAVVLFILAGLFALAGMDGDGGAWVLAAICGLGGVCCLNAKDGMI